MFPELEPSNRDNEYRLYTDKIKSEVVFKYLFEGLSHKKLDNQVIGLNPEKSKGWQSFNILHYLGLVNKHKNYFNNTEVDDAINILKEIDKEKYKLIIKLITNYSKKEFLKEDIEEELEKEIQKSKNDKSSNRKKRLDLNKNKKPEKIKIISNGFIRNPDVIVEVLIRAGGICELCLKNAPFIRAKDNTPYLEVHHIIPLSEGGVDTVKNAIALCPNCHRKLHFGIK